MHSVVTLQEDDRYLAQTQTSWVEGDVFPAAIERDAVMDFSGRCAEEKFTGEERNGGYSLTRKSRGKN
jgi:hypothetical protein